MSDEKKGLIELGWFGDMPKPDPARGDAIQNPDAKTPICMWVLECPFRKNGFPVLGTFGSRSGNVVIFTIDAWKRLCQDVPGLQTTVFEVGHYEE